MPQKKNLRAANIPSVKKKLSFTVRQDILKSGFSVPDRQKASPSKDKVAAMSSRQGRALLMCVERIHARRRRPGSLGAIRYPIPYLKHYGPKDGCRSEEFPARCVGSTGRPGVISVLRACFSGGGVGERVRA